MDPLSGGKKKSVSTVDQTVDPKTQNEGGYVRFRFLSPFKEQTEEAAPEGVCVCQDFAGPGVLLLFEEGCPTRGCCCVVK